MGGIGLRKLVGTKGGHGAGHTATDTLIDRPAGARCQWCYWEGRPIYSCLLASGSGWVGWEGHSVRGGKVTDLSFSLSGALVQGEGLQVYPCHRD